MKVIGTFWIMIYWHDCDILLFKFSIIILKDIDYSDHSLDKMYENGGNLTELRIPLLLTNIYLIINYFLRRFYWNANNNLVNIFREILN